MNMKIGIASDHRGYLLKEELITFLQESYDIVDYGTKGEDAVDYPDYAIKLGEAIQKQEVQYGIEYIANKYKPEYGIAICGSGIGISIACNKVQGVRAAKVDTKDEVIATRCDNDANIICLSAKMDLETAKELVITFLTTPFSNEERHRRRIQKISDYERNC